MNEITHDQPWILHGNKNTQRRMYTVYSLSALSAQEFPKIVQRCTNLFLRWDVNQISQGLCTTVTLFVHCLFTCTCLQAQTSRSEQVVNKQCNCSAQSLGQILVHFPLREQTCTSVPLHNFEEILGHIELTSAGVAGFTVPPSGGSPGPPILEKKGPLPDRLS